MTTDLNGLLARIDSHLDDRVLVPQPGRLINLVTTAHPSLCTHRDPTSPSHLHPNLGRLVQPRSFGNIVSTAEAGIPWAADNDCFQGLDENAYINMLDGIMGLPGCRFVTVPDVVADAAATKLNFDLWQPLITDLGLSCALVLQDGQENVPIPWSRISTVFIGGSDEFKLGPIAAHYAREAKKRNKWVHWGRVNSRKRIAYILSTGAADSYDGTNWCRFRKKKLNQGLQWTRELTA